VAKLWGNRGAGLTASCAGTAFYHVQTSWRPSVERRADLATVVRAEATTAARYHSVSRWRQKSIQAVYPEVLVGAFAVVCSAQCTEPAAIASNVAVWISDNCMRSFWLEL
jgi:hypothetical protein